MFHKSCKLYTKCLWLAQIVEYISAVKTAFSKPYKCIDYIYAVLLGIAGKEYLCASIKNGRSCHLLGIAPGWFSPSVLLLFWQMQIRKCFVRKVEVFMFYLNRLYITGNQTKLKIAFGKKHRNKTTEVAWKE